jgi:hypothetical protein
VWLVLCIGVDLYGQDALYSQPELAPLWLNPALSGSAHAKRASGAWRMQRFGGVALFRTVHASFDMELSSKERRRDNSGGLGVGLTLLSDRAGDPELRTNAAWSTVAYTIALSEYSRLGTGLAAGVDQHSVDPASGKWGSQ